MYLLVYSWFHILWNISYFYILKMFLILVGENFYLTLFLHWKVHLLHLCLYGQLHLLIFLNVLNQPCISRTSPICSWCIMLFDIFLDLIVYILLWLSTVPSSSNFLLNSKCSACKSREVSLDQSSIQAHQALFPIMSHDSSALTQLLSYSGSWGESYYNLLFSTLPKSCWVHPSPPIFPTSLELLITLLLFSR